MNKEKLKKLQECEAEILDVFDKFCKKNNIRYSLYAGTALGAVRHKGFIPWDDDIDVCMLRHEYEKFVRLWKLQENDDYFFQDPEDEKITINHAKLRKNNTILSSRIEYEKSGHHGIWIDIFPIDKVPKHSLKRKIFLTLAKIRLVYTRGYPVENKGNAMKWISRVMLCIPKKLQIVIRKYLDQYVKKYYKMKNDYELISLACPEGLGYIFPANMLDTICNIKFMDYEFCIAEKYDEMLTITYGDYMKLPPIEERICKHNPEIIEFDAK